MRFVAFCKNGNQELNFIIHYIFTSHLKQSALSEIKTLFISIVWFLFKSYIPFHAFSSSVAMRLSVLAALAGSATSAILWDGRFNDMSSSVDLNKWSWSDEVGPYQYYIASTSSPSKKTTLMTSQHGSENVTSYVNLSPSYKNPADSGSTQGAKINLDKTSYWNGQTMRRTELIPQTSAKIMQEKSVIISVL